MIRLPRDLIGTDVELDPVELACDDVRRYALMVDDQALARGACTIAPLGMALALRGGPMPEVPLERRTVSVHGGHTITALAPLVAPARYVVRARLVDVFEKSGRSGRLTVIVRRAEISGPSGDCRVVVEDQQIVRWRASDARVFDRPQLHAHIEERAPTVGAGVSTLELGTLIGPWRCAAPSAERIAAYAHGARAAEALFVDARFARGLGYADVIVPGPLQTALVERLLRDRLPEWNLCRLSVSFRQAVIAGEPINLAAEVTEHCAGSHCDVLVTDLWVENGHGDRVALGVAELRR